MTDDVELPLRKEITECMNSYLTNYQSRKIQLSINYVTKEIMKREEWM